MSARLGKGWTVRSKVWLEIDGEPVLGQGRLAILEAIDRRGSILGAARDTGIPYRRIWGAIRDMERRVGHRLVQAHRGGKAGGGAQLTDEARELMAHFLRLQEGIREIVDVRFDGLFLRGDMRCTPNGG